MSVTDYLPQWMTQIPLNMEGLPFSLLIGGVTLVLMLLYLWLTKKDVPVLRQLVLGTTKPRFRKREKFMFYGRKVLRSVKSFAKSNNGNSSGSGRRGRESRKKKLVMGIARRLLRFKNEQQPQLKVREPPPFFLEVDWPEFDYEHRLPAELMYMLRNVRVLGHFEKPIFLELCRFMESRFIPANGYLFKIGDPDDSIYVVKEGRVHVFITEPDGKECLVKEVNSGESIHSLLSIMDVLTGHPAPYKTVSALAVTDSTILRLPAHSFRIVLERFPESMVRVIQIIMIRLQRVTFMALHNYLGLTTELVRQENQSDKNCRIHSLTSGPKGSPMHGSHAMREGRVAPAGAENESSTNQKSITTQMSVPDDDESAGLKKSDGNVKAAATEKVSNRKRSSSMARKYSEGARSVGVRDVQERTSDFVMACSRAGLGSLLDDNLPISTGNAKTGYEEGQQSTPTRRQKKSVVVDTVNVISIPPSLTHTTNASGAGYTDHEILSMATQDIAKLLGLEDESLLAGKCHLQYFRAGSNLVKQGDQECNLHFLITGLIQVQQQVIGSESEQKTLYVTYPGQLINTLPVLTGEPSPFTIRIVVDSRLVVISKNDFYVIMKEQPSIVLNVGNTIVQRMSAFVRQIDFALDWMLIEAGRALYRQGERSDCVYIILSGRLRSVVQHPSGKKELVGEFGRGELVGIVEVLTMTNRSTTMMAVRDTELAQIPDELLNLIKRKYPQIVTRLIHLLGQRILGSLSSGSDVKSFSGLHVNNHHHSGEPRPTVSNLATVAILSVSEKVPLSTFTLELQHALNGIGPTMRLNSEIVQNKLGSAAFDSINEYRLSSWLGQLEDVHRMVLYQCDMRMTPWTQRCIRQADCILILALHDLEPCVGQLEKQMENMSVRAQKEFILLHEIDGPKPKNTVEWLNLRDWCSSHHHIRCPKRVFSRRPQSSIMETYKNLSKNRPDPLSDFSRLARFLTGTSIGLVLGGGGARGCSHVGIIQAMTEAGIPIDIVGGTSIGSFMGALWCEENNFTRFKQRAREWATTDMNCLWKKVLDLTYPVTAMFSGAEFNKSIESVFQDTQIEDLWIPYFCVTTDLSASRMRVHTHGSLWRYVRSSMTLAGYLPPLCDPDNGHLLLDGGYVNNLPADVMKSMGAQSIFAIDVGSQDETDLTNYGDTLSGWWLLWNKWNPWGAHIKVPNMAEIQSRLAYVSCVRHLEIVKDSGCCEYIRPPIDKYHTLQFGSFDEICAVGYTHGKLLFSEWQKTGRVQELLTENHDKDKHKTPKNIMTSSANFTDLAELISRIDDPQKLPSVESSCFGDDDDEERISVTSEPIVSMMSPRAKHRARGGSEGASPHSDSCSSVDEDDYEYDEEINQTVLADQPNSSSLSEKFDLIQSVPLCQVPTVSCSSPRQQDYIYNMGAAQQSTDDVPNQPILPNQPVKTSDEEKLQKTDE